MKKRILIVDEEKDVGELSKRYSKIMDSR
jgi:hypothetical protein